MRLASPVLVTLGIVALFACGHLDQDELDCEEAVSVLKDCCPGFDTSPLQCIHASNGCTGGTDPALSEDDSACVRAESCSKLVSTGVCARAQAARACTYGGNDPSTGSAYGSSCVQPAVCP